MNKNDYDTWGIKNLDPPEYLFHYTTVESLALILKSHSIKFSPLTNLDDLEEAKFNDLKKIGNYCFVSSWTNEEKESIPMWKMYTGKDNGVRIKMKSRPFKLYEDELNDNSFFKTLIPFHLLKEQNIFCKQYQGGEGPFKVIYTDDENCLYPKLIEQGKNELYFGIGEIGKYKRTAWKFQKEYRYILNIFPMNMNVFPDDKNQINQFMKKINIELNQAIRGDMEDSLEESNQKSFYLKISDDAYENIEITLSPFISDGNRAIVDVLKEKYAPNMKIKESDLFEKIR